MNWWDKLVFRFLPTYTSIDWARDPDQTCAVHFKRYRGKVHIVGIEFIPGGDGKKPMPDEFRGPYRLGDSE